MPNERSLLLYIKQPLQRLCYLLAAVLVLQAALVLLLLALLLLPDIAAVRVSHPPALKLTAFQNAINDAGAELEQQYLVRTLFALNAQNSALVWQQHDNASWVKAVALMSEATYYKYYLDKTQAQAPQEQVAKIWVTLVPQVQQFCQQLALEDPSFRIKQYLGLDPHRAYQRFMEIWLRPEDIFRPCKDPEPDDYSCELTMRTEPIPTVKGIKDYPSYFAALKREAYTPWGAPWTRLGYTYDWAYSTRAVGASEYIVVPQAQFRIDGSYTIAEYCSNR